MQKKFRLTAKQIATICGISVGLFATLLGALVFLTTGDYFLAIGMMALINLFGILKFNYVSKKYKLKGDDNGSN